MKTLVSFLGVNYEDAMLKYYETTEEEGLEPKSFSSWKGKNSEPIKKEEALKYNKLLDNDRLEFETITRDLLEEFNYLI